MEKNFLLLIWGPECFFQCKGTPCSRSAPEAWQLGDKIARVRSDSLSFAVITWTIRGGQSTE